MNEKNFRRIINNPRHISGVHNYCDRWCERCPLTLRCSVYAMETAMEMGKRPHDRADESLWPRLEAVQALAEKLLSENVGHAGVGLTRNPKFKSQDRPVDSDRLVAAKRYMEFSHVFVNEQCAVVPTLPAVSEVPVTPAEAFEVINHYHMFITVKISRAVNRDEIDEEFENDPEFADMPNDHDGSAKIALIAIDRSVLAWVVLSRVAPALRDTALSAMLTLHRLREGVEKYFPKARSFRRPGFDTLRFPNKKSGDV